MAYQRKVWVNNKSIITAESLNNIEEGIETALSQSSGGGAAFTPEDKTKLDGIEEGANKYTHPANHPATMITEDDDHKFMTDAEKTKLTGIEEGANKYTHPTNHPATIITEDDTHKFATKAEKDKLAGIEEGANKYTHPANHPATVITEDDDHKFVTKAEKEKLTGIEAGANKYVHPENHPASIITQDANNRFVTDAEKTAWNAKASTALATTEAAGLVKKCAAQEDSKAADVPGLLADFNALLAKLRAAGLM